MTVVQLTYYGVNVATTIAGHKREDRMVGDSSAVPILRIDGRMGHSRSGSQPAEHAVSTCDVCD